MQVAPRYDVKDIVASTLHGQSRNEAALDRILEKIDSRAGPPMVDASSFENTHQLPTDPANVSPVPLLLGPPLQYYVDAERGHTTRYTPATLPTSCP